MNTPVDATSEENADATTVTSADAPTDTPVSTPATQSTPERPRLFSLSQRIGRLRYFAYTLIGMVGCALLLVLIYLLALLLPVELGRMISTIAFVLVKSLVIPLIVFTLTMRRLRDFNLSGWWALTILMPLVTLAYLFIPGTRGENRFGPPPAPNPPSLRFISIAIPIALLSVYFSLYGGKGSLDGSAPATPGIKALPAGPGLKAY